MKFRRLTVVERATSDIEDHKSELYELEKKMALDVAHRVYRQSEITRLQNLVDAIAKKEKDDQRNTEVV